MNSSLAIFAFFLVVVGAVSGLYPVSILGVFLLIAALVAPTRRLPPRPQPIPTGSKRTTAPPPSHIRTEPKLLQPQPQAQPQSAQSMSPISIVQVASPTPVLFPNTMFPFINPVTPTQQPLEQKPAGEKPESRDEVLELAAIAVALRLLSGQGT